MGVVHARAIRAAGATITRVAARRLESAQRVTAEFGGSAVASVEELVDADDVDVIHICTPNHLHAKAAELALGAGKHVICEKPLATSAADAAGLAALAANTDVVTAVPFVNRFYPTLREARARIGEGDGGRLWLLHGSYLQDWLAAPTETNWRVDPALGGASRAFGDIGVHWCDLMEFVTGHRIVRLIAQTSQAFQERTEGGASAPVATEDGALVLFQTDQGANGSLVVSQVSPGRKNKLSFSFDGPDAAYVFDSDSPETLLVGNRSENRIVVKSPDTLRPSAAAYANVPAGHPQGYQDCFNAFVKDTYAAVGGNPPNGLPTFADGYRAATLTAAVVESARSQTWVEVTGDTGTQAPLAQHLN
jgi:predicted dehydrogenase